jgi:hypothetical protein
VARKVLAVSALVFVAFASAAEAAALRLAWDANPETNIAGYRILYGTTANAYTTTVDVGNRTNYTISGLSDGRRYYIALQAYNTSGLSSSLSSEVSGVAAVDPTPSAANILLGQGPNSAGGGFFAIHGGVEHSFGANAFAQIPWPSYNASGGGVRLATGDVDGDGLDEVVVGLGRGSNGWVAILDDVAHGYALLQWVQVSWPAYNAANGEVYPAVGNLDGDSRAEIVLGLGNGGGGWFAVLDDASANFQHMRWNQVNWPWYNARNGRTHPAVGDVDGDGVSEIVLGLGSGSTGWMAVINNATSNFSHRRWIQSNWSVYNVANGTTYPALGDVDNDGRDEIVVGLGAGSQGYFQIIDDETTSYAPRSWQMVSWAAYNALSGETHPAVGNVDGDAAEEIVLGLAEFTGNGGWFEIRDDSGQTYRSLGWRNIGWAAFTASGGALFPAIADR